MRSHCDRHRYRTDGIDDGKKDDVRGTGDGSPIPSPIENEAATVWAVD